jgi:hypothetical protein
MKDFGFKPKQALPRTLATFPDHNLVELWCHSTHHTELLNTQTEPERHRLRSGLHQMLDQLTRTWGLTPFGGYRFRWLLPSD